MPAPETPPTEAVPVRHSAWEVLLVFLKLGTTSFGGPIAHLGYFRTEFVERRAWMSDEEYADLVALCQFLPGPASSQVGFAIGLRRARFAGACAAFLGFTLPSAVLMVAFAFGAALFTGPLGTGLLTGLKIVAVAIIAQAVLGMARTLTPDSRRASIAAAAAMLALLLPGSLGQVAAIAAGAIAGVFLCRDAVAASPGDHAGARAAAAKAAATATAPTATATPAETTTPTTTAAEGRVFPVTRRVGMLCLALFGVLLVGAPLIALTTGSTWVSLFDAFYRSGALVFGGGHVVLPLLEASVVGPGWVNHTDFLGGYGAAQAVPGPLFTFAAYLGALSTMGPGGVLGATIALLAIFLPGFLLLIGVLPFWNSLRQRTWARSIMRGANAAVVGILASALFTPVFTTAITGAGAFSVALVCFVLLVSWRLPPWVVVLAGAAGGVLLTLLA